ncbi:MAG: agmatinase [Deltaproteobacteria bacterium]|nr:agmatinase [Deltaproteobacteria bacterium]
MNLHELKTLLEQQTTHKIAVMGIPYDANSSFMRGTAEAPPLIRKAFFSDASNLWTETGVNLGAEDLLLDAGDLTFGPGEDPLTVIEDSTALLLERSILPIALGGDHAISYPIIRAFRQKYRKLNVLLFDAHPDLYNEFQGSRYSHACPFARIMEEQLTDRLVQVGIRAMNGHQHRQAEKFGVEVIEMRHWKDENPLSFDAPVYISLDMDALDPAFAPGVSHREPGGFTTRQVIDALHMIKGTIVGADIVEYNPRNDALGVTAAVGAKLMKELAGQLILRNHPETQEKISSTEH